MHPLRGEALISGTTAYVTWIERAEWGIEEDGAEVMDLWITRAGSHEELIASGVDAACSVRNSSHRAFTAGRVGTICGELEISEMMEMMEMLEMLETREMAEIVLALSTPSSFIMSLFICC